MGIQYLYGFTIALALSLLFISFLIRYSARLGLMDDPAGDARKLHSETMPRSGGLGIILAASLALLAVLPLDSSLFSFLLACSVIICFGLLDDILTLSPLQKLGGQAICVAIAMAGGMVLIDFPLLANCPAWFAYVVTLFFVMGVINGVNFSDGMDGLAAGTTLMALLLILILAIECGDTQVAVIALAVSAALLGFLRYNTHPASIFMGDVGSQFLGFVVAWLAITMSQSETSPMTTLMPLLILGIPVMDILQVVPVRIYKQLPLPGPDKEHFHHQLAKMAFRQDEVVAIIYVLQAILLGAAYLLRYANDEVVLGFYAAYVVPILGIVYWANTSGWQVRAPQSAGSHRRRNRFFRRLGILHPYTGKFIGISIVIFLAIAAIVSSALSTGMVRLALGWAAVLLAIKLFSRNLWPLALGRLVTYTTISLLVYGMTLSVNSPLGNRLIDGTLVIFALVVAFSIRITRKQYFWLTTEDLLMLMFILLLAPLLPFDFGEEFSVSQLIFRTCILLYASEYILSRGEQARTRLTSATIMALFLTGVHLW